MTIKGEIFGLPMCQQIKGAISQIFKQLNHKNEMNSIFLQCHHLERTIGVSQSPGDQNSWFEL